MSPLGGSVVHRRKISYLYISSFHFIVPDSFIYTFNVFLMCEAPYILNYLALDVLTFVPDKKKF